MLTHARSFLCTALVGPFCANNNKPFVLAKDWSVMPHYLRKNVGKNASPTYFYPFFPGTPTPKTPPTPALTSSSMSPDFTTTLFQEFRSSIASNNHLLSSTSKGEILITDLEFERTLLKKVCGQQPDCNDSVLSSWYSLLFQKNQDKKDKDHLLAELLTGKSCFKDVDLPIYPELKKLALEWNWVGVEAGDTPKYAYACYDISPFAMLDLSEDEIADMEFNDSYLLIHRAL